MNSFIKNLIRAKDNFYKKFVHKNNNMYHHYAFKNLQNHLNQSIQIAKQNCAYKLLKVWVIQILIVSATGHSWKHC